MSTTDQEQDGVSSIPRRAEQDPAEQIKRGPVADEHGLRVEELEDRIAPRLASNHNETLLLS